MTAEQIFDVWAPQGGRWSAWAKPVVFAHLGSGGGSGGGIDAPASDELAGVLPFADDLRWVPPSDGATAIVVDLPDAQGVMLGLELAARGYRPVPLYNAVPHPVSGGGFGPSGGGSVVDMTDVLAALRAGAVRLERTSLSPDAPPAFLLDARRREGAGPAALRPGQFDNRSVSLPTDFPSANYLLAHGVRRVVLVQLTSPDPLPDLAHTLRRWQEAGIELLAHTAGGAEPIAPIEVKKPAWYRHMWYGLVALMAFRRSPLGGFGGFIPEPGSAG